MQSGGGRVHRSVRRCLEAHMSDGFKIHGLPESQGLYDPRNEHDACGIGFVANISGLKSHDIILKGIEILDQPRPPRGLRMRPPDG